MIVQKKLDNIILEPVIISVIQKLNNMSFKCLIVGGAVRDAILGIKPKDIDIEVYGASYDYLCKVLKLFGSVNLVGASFGVVKFKPVGSEIDYDFSIPRRENKIGVKHQDFEITFDKEMSVFDAAERRDFSFNSLAYDPINFEIHDYFGGMDDIKNGVIRHTSEKFSEDLLRILRAMQFQARFGFSLHPETAAIIRQMLKDENFDEIPKERVFTEWIKWAEKGTRHDLVFKFLRDTGLIHHYPELERLKDTIQDAIYHPEGDVEIHTELCLAHIDKVIESESIVGQDKIILVMSVLLHDIAKPYTTEEKEKKGRLVVTSEGHEELGGDMCLVILPRMGFHDELTIPISKLVENHLAGVNISMIDKLSGRQKSVKKLSKRLFPSTIKQLLFLMEADTNGRGGTEIKVPTGAKEIMEISEQIEILEKPYEYLLMGRHLIQEGLKPSPLFKEILEQSYEAQVSGDFSDIDGAIVWLQRNIPVFLEKYPNLISNKKSI